jgi:hypothetical protein
MRYARANDLLPEQQISGSRIADKGTVLSAKLDACQNDAGLREAGDAERLHAARSDYTFAAFQRALSWP